VKLCDEHWTLNVGSMKNDRHKQINKPVGLILHGHGLKDLDDKIEMFRDIDIFWVSLNSFWIAEDVIRKIDKVLDAVVNLTDEEPNEIKLYPEAERYKSNGGWFLDIEAFKAVDPEIFAGNNGYPSFYFIILFFMKLGAKQFYLFGANGYARSKEDVYYNQQSIPIEAVHADHPKEYERDMENLRFLFKDKNPYKGAEVFNCTPDTHYEFFPKITLEEAVTRLKQ